MKKADWREYRQLRDRLYTQEGCTMSETFYHGQREPEVAWAWKHRGGISYPLAARLDLWNHSPTGFEWGYGGSGPAQLALAILADVLGDDLQAVELHQQFKWEHVAKWDGPTWKIGVDAVLRWAFEHDQEAQDAQHALPEDRYPIDLAAGALEEQPHVD